MHSREVTTLSASAIGSLIGGLIASPLGPWATIGAATLGTTLGGIVGGSIWHQFYLDMGEKLAEARSLIEHEKPLEAASLLLSLREHQRFADQEQHFRSELEFVAAQVLRGLAQRSLAAGDDPAALQHFRQALIFLPRDPDLLWQCIRLGTAVGEPSYEDSGRLERELRTLLAAAPDHPGALRSLAELLERRSRHTEAASLLKEAIGTGSPRADLLEEWLRWVLRLLPDDTASISQLADLLVDSGRAAEAIPLLETAAHHFADPDEHSLLLGKALHASGERAAARPLLDPLADRSPLAGLLAGTAAASCGDTPAAITLLSRVASDPTHGRDAALALVPLLIAAGDLEIAFNHLQREGLHESPLYESLLGRLAKAFEGRGQETRASQVYDLMKGLGDSSAFWSRFTLQYRDGSPVVLGRGSAGRVLLGRRRADLLPVAIREASAPSAIGGKAARRFSREVEVLSRLTHPNLVRLLGHALPESKCLLATEYCAGGSLADRLSPPPLWAQSKTILESVCDALAFLHSRTPPLVHRDVKPSNILFAADGTVKISDFSMARAADAAGTSVVTSVKERSALYLYQSPEIILGQGDTTPAADVYSTGCVLYHLLTGRPPFVYEDVNAQISAHFQQPPLPPSSLASWVPPQLDTVVLRCLEKEPARRYSDARLLWLDLRSI